MAPVDSPAGKCPPNRPEGGCSVFSAGMAGDLQRPLSRESETKKCDRIHIIVASGPLVLVELFLRRQEAAGDQEFHGIC